MANTVKPTDTKTKRPRPERRDDAGLRKLVMRVTLVLGVLTVVLCITGWFFVGEPALEHANRVSEFGRSLPASVGDVVWDHLEIYEDTNDDGELDSHRFVLVVGPRTPVASEDIPALQDAVWKAYALAFREGGMSIDQVAIGGPSVGDAVEVNMTNQGAVVGWDANVVDVADLEERTGIAAPPLSEFMELQRTWGSSN